MIPTIARDSHTLDAVLTFQTATGDLDAYRCTCGRMFDAARWTAHLEREAGR